MEIVGDVAGPHELPINNFRNTYLVSDLVKELCLINGANMPPNCNKLGHWFEAKQTLFSYLQTETETWI